MGVIIIIITTLFNEGYTLQLKTEKPVALPEWRHLLVNVLPNSRTQ